MFNKSKKSLIVLLAAIFAAALLCVGVSLLSPKAQKAYAAEGDVVQVKASTTKSYATFDDAITDIGNISNGNVEIKLLGNAMATKELSSGNNAKYFTLDLNGYALTVNSPVKCARLTLKDSMAGTTDSAYLHEISNPTTADTTDTVQIYGGVLTNPSGRALTVGSTYEVAMESGTIAGCADSGVYVDRGDFTMTGGTISYNTATYGGGVYIQEGDFTMTGGTISYNTTTEKNGGGGVCVASSTTFNISGAPKIKDNKRSTDDHAKDVSSYNDAINVNGALTVGAEIYIDWTVKITGYTQSEKPSQYFKSDDPTKCAQAGVNGDVALSAHTGGTATCKAKAVCTHCGESYGELAAHNYVDGVCTVCGAKVQIYWGVSDDGTTLAISGNASDTDSFDEAKKGGFDFDASFSAPNYAPWYSNRETITTVDIKDGVAPACLNYWFYNMPNIESVNLTNLDASNVIDMRWTFQNSTKLSSVTFPDSFNTEKVTNMACMFMGCSGLTSLDLSSFDTAEVTNTSYMFYNCGGLTSLDLSSFDTAKVTSMMGMFNGCSSLGELTFPATFTTAEVTSMYFMFSDCAALTSLDLSSFNTAKVTTMAFMFKGCTNLASVEISSFNTEKVENMTGMFQECQKLASIEFPATFKASKVTTMQSMFENCKALVSLDLSPFDTDALTVAVKMFKGCEKLSSVTFSQTFNTAKVNSMQDMFSGCAALTSLDLSSFDTGMVQVTSGMFKDCAKLATIKTPATIGSVALPLPDSTTEWWNVDGNAPLTGQITSASAGKTLKLHAGHSGGTATCQNKATCEVCGQEYGEIGTHNLVHHDAKAATCTEEGVLAHDHCSVCGKDFIDNVETSAEQLVIAKTAHEYETEFTVDKAATCTENGSKSKHCKHCDSKTEVTEITATGHHFTHHGAVDATTESEGNTEYWSCADCDKYFSDEGGATEITDKASVVIPKITVTPAEKKSYLWLLWLLIPLALAAGGVTYGIYLYKKKKRM